MIRGLDGNPEPINEVEPKEAPKPKPKKNQPLDIIDTYEIFPSGLCLALIGGFLDAYTYTLHNRVFANAQTGNMVLFAIYLAEGSSLCLKYLIQIVAFFLGIIVTDIIQSFISPKSRFKKIIFISVVEFISLFIIGFIPESFPSEWLCGFVAFINGLQATVFRKIGTNVCCTTMCTGNLRSFGDNLIEAIVNCDLAALKRSGIYFTIILFFMAGGVISKLMCVRFGIQAIWFCNAMIFVNVIAVFIHHRYVKNLKKKQLEKAKREEEEDLNEI